MYGILLFLHILAATIWTGGHLVLATAVLPGVLRDRSPEALLRFEIPKLSEENLSAMAWHIVPVTIVSVLFVFVGVAFRTGWLY